VSTVSNKSIQKILYLMNENSMIGGSTPNLTGAAYAQEGSIPSMGQNIMQGFNSGEPIDELEINETYTEKEVKLTRRYIQLLGGGERARDLLEKVISADNIIGVEEPEQQQENREKNQIDQIAMMVPSEVDTPTDFSSRFNPSSNR